MHAVRIIMFCTGYVIPLCAMYKRCSRYTLTAIAFCLFVCLLFVPNVLQSVNYRPVCNTMPLLLRENSRHVLAHDWAMSSRFNELLARKATASDPDLIKFIRDMMVPPSKSMVKLSTPLVNTPQSKEIDAIFAKKVYVVFS